MTLLSYILASPRTSTVLRPARSLFSLRLLPEALSLLNPQLLELRPPVISLAFQAGFCAPCCRPQALLSCAHSSSEASTPRRALPSWRAERAQTLCISGGQLGRSAGTLSERRDPFFRMNSPRVLLSQHPGRPFSSFCDLVSSPPASSAHLPGEEAVQRRLRQRPADRCVSRPGRHTPKIVRKASEPLTLPGEQRGLPRARGIWLGF